MVFNVGLPGVQPHPVMMQPEFNLDPNFLQQVLADTAAAQQQTQIPMMPTQNPAAVGYIPPAVDVNPAAAGYIPSPQLQPMGTGEPQVAPQGAGMSQLGEILGALGPSSGEQMRPPSPIGPRVGNYNPGHSLMDVLALAAQNQQLGQIAPMGNLF